MKKLIKLFVLTILITALVLPLAACGSEDAMGSKDAMGSEDGLAGTYKAVVDGYSGDLQLSVELDDQGEILSVNVDKHTETEGIGTIATDQVPGEIVKSQSLDVDNISGATVTVDAIVLAVAKALESAELDPANYDYSLADMDPESDSIDYTIDRSTMPVKRETTDSVTLTDARGREVTIDLPISSYAISTMDVIDYIIPLKGEEAFEILVGSGQDGGHGFNQYAELYLPVVGNYLKHTGQISDHNAPFDLEMILSMEPDVLIVNSAMGAHNYALDVEEQLSQIGTEIVLIDVPGKNIDSSVQKTMDILGKIFQEEERAAEVSQFIDEQFNLIASKNLDEKDQPTVYYEKSGYSQVFGSTSTSQRGWGLVVDIAGGENIADELLLETAGSKGASNTLDPEYVIDKDPDYIVTSGINPGWLAILDEREDPSYDIINRNGWKDLKAVKNDNLYEFAHATSRSIYAFYPALKLAKIFYPEEFAEVNPEAKLEEFFDRFMILDSDITIWFHELKDAR